MRILLTFIFSINNLIGFSQAGNNEVEAEYQLFCDTYSATKLYTSLYANNNVSIYHEKFSTAEDWQEHKKPLPEGAIELKSTTVYEPYLKTDQVKKEILFYSLIGPNNFLVRDEYYNFDWKISPDTKNISGYLCIKATTLFRGREWVAWFVPDIPVPFGPWKLHGLPGLIVEAYDTSNKYTFKLVKIEYKKSDILSTDFATLMRTKNIKPISYQQFLQDTEEFSDNITKDIRDPNITITRIPIPREGEELKYEWEK